MKRDMDLVRHILLTARDTDNALSVHQFMVSDNRWSKEFILYHIEMMNEIGLINGQVVKADGGVYYNGGVRRLTWKGQDFCDSISDERVWNKVKTTISKGIGGASFQVMVSTISKISNKLIDNIIN